MRAGGWGKGVQGGNSALPLQLFCKSQIIPKHKVPFEKVHPTHIGLQRPAFLTSNKNILLTRVMAPSRPAALLSAPFSNDRGAREAREETERSRKSYGAIPGHEWSAWKHGAPLPKPLLLEGLIFFFFR